MSGCDQLGMPRWPPIAGRVHVRINVMVLLMVPVRVRMLVSARASCFQSMPSFLISRRGVPSLAMRIDHTRAGSTCDGT